VPHLLCRPKLKPAVSVFDELDGADLDNRWTACVALTTEIWGRGLLGCSCQAERAEWMDRTTDYFDQVRNVFLAGHIAATEEIKPGGPVVPLNSPSR
jgi:hypothetical protein